MKCRQLPVWRRSLVAMAVAWGATGCSPSLNWREVRPAEGVWVGMFPCRPDGLSRQLPLKGASLAWQLQVCEGEGRTFSVGNADVGDKVNVEPMLAALKQAALGGLVDAAVTPLQWEMAGAAPVMNMGRWRISGRGPQGQSVHLDLALFSRGTNVVQAMVISPTPLTDADGLFIEGLRLAP